MKKAFAAWKWSVGVVARSHRTVVVLAALIALWGYAAYEWLGLAESSALLLILALVWAIVQLLAAAVMVGGTVAGAAEAAATEGRCFPFKWLWTFGRKKLLTTLLFGLICLGFVWLCSAVFDWINAHAVEVASFLTFHLQKPVSYVLIGEIYEILENLLWIIFAGFLLSFFVALLRAGWRGATKRVGSCLPDVLSNPFLTSLLSLGVFGGLAYELANWHPVVPPGFWDYTAACISGEGRDPSALASAFSTLSLHSPFCPSRFIQ